MQTVLRLIGSKSAVSVPYDSVNGLFQNDTEIYVSVKEKRNSYVVEYATREQAVTAFARVDHELEAFKKERRQDFLSWVDWSA